MYFWKGNINGGKTLTCVTICIDLRLIKVTIVWPQKTTKPPSLHSLHPLSWSFKVLVLFVELTFFYHNVRGSWTFKVFLQLWQPPQVSLIRCFRLHTHTDATVYQMHFQNTMKRESHKSTCMFMELYISLHNGAIIMRQWRRQSGKHGGTSPVNALPDLPPNGNGTKVHSLQERSALLTTPQFLLNPHFPRTPLLKPLLYLRSLEGVVFRTTVFISSMSITVLYLKRK